MQTIIILYLWPSDMTLTLIVLENIFFIPVSKYQLYIDCIESKDTLYLIALDGHSTQMIRFLHAYLPKYHIYMYEINVTFFRNGRSFWSWLFNLKKILINNIFVVFCGVLCDIRVNLSFMRVLYYLFQSLIII